MKSLKDTLNEGLFGRLFKKSQKEVENDSLRNKDNLNLYARYGWGYITDKEALKIMEIKMYSKESNRLFNKVSFADAFENSGKKVDFEGKLKVYGFFQGMLDRAYYEHLPELIKQNPFGESSCDMACNYAVEDNKEDFEKIPSMSRSTAYGGYELPVIETYFKGWSFAERINIKSVSHYRVNFKTGKIKTI